MVIELLNAYTKKGIAALCGIGLGLLVIAIIAPYLPHPPPHLFM